MSRRRTRGFTLIELLVVVAIIALLLSILLPSLSGAREQGKRAVCLSNLSGIGKALWQYAGEDKAETTVPIHMNMIGYNDEGQTTGANLPYWLWRCANWFAWGGKSAEIPFLATQVNAFMLDEPSTPGEPPPAGSTWRPEYGVRHRPLSYFITGGNLTQSDRKKLDWFRCPSDTGYPDDWRANEAPKYNATRPMYLSVGSSYRASLIMYGLRTQSGAGPYNGAFSLGPWGARISTIPDASRVVWMGEPTWFNMIRRDGTDEQSQKEQDLFGWHKKKMVDNLLFVDGSVRGTRAETQVEMAATSDELHALTENFERYGDVRLDIYPAGGSLIWNEQFFLDYYVAGSAGYWPFGNYQHNLNTH